MRGRKPDAPGLQAAKGNPGRRKSKVEKRIAEAERVAEMLAQPAPGADPLATPPIIEGWAPAIAVWRDLAPRLKSTHRLSPQHRPIFALFCVYFAEWVIANEDVVANGHTQNVKTVAGGYMERVRPIVAIRDHAFDKVMKLSERFGLTPSDEYGLFREQMAAASSNPGLFGNDTSQAKAADTDAQSDDVADNLIGSLDTLDTPPPHQMN